MTDPSVLATALSAVPMRAFDDLAARATNAPPPRHGFYAWWQTPGALSGVQATPHPTADLELLYVGIAPGRPGSSSHLRKRLGTHHRGAIGSSTLRFTLAAFLWQTEGWRPYLTSRPTLAPGELAELQTWQREHLAVQWVEVDEPWVVEESVVGLMRPPLNREHNAGHPAYGVVGEARRVLRLEASNRGAPD